VVAFGPSELILTASHDGKACLWDGSHDGRLVACVKHERWISAAAFSPDGKSFVTGSLDWTARRWDLNSNELNRLRHQDDVRAIAFHPNDPTLILTGSADGLAQLWNTGTGAPSSEPLKHNDAVGVVAFSPDGRMILTGSEDNTSWLWDTAAKRRFRLKGHHGAVLAVAFSPDGKIAVTGSRDKTARFWDTATGNELAPHVVHGNEVMAVAFSPNGQFIVTASADRTARLWDRATRKPIGPPLVHEGWVWVAAFSPDGRYVLTGGDHPDAWLWKIPAPVQGDAHQILLWTQVLTGQELTADGAARDLDVATWQQRRELLNKRGGAPMP
jgi:WD40 repeat protein